MNVCFRNNSGEFIAGLTSWQQLTLSTEEGGALTLLQAMNESKHRGFEESNSKVIPKCWVKLFVQSSKTIHSFFFNF
jgi:hypothetical protein